MFSCYSHQSDLQPAEMSKLVTYLSMMMLLLAIPGTTQIEGGPCQGVVKESELDECAEDLLTRSVSSISQVAKKCSATESCLKRENCPTVDEMYKMLKDDSVRERIIKTLKNQICNMKERAFCCKEEDKRVCPAGESCKDVSECTEVEEKVKRIQSGNLPYSESIKIYDNLKSRMCDSQSMFCCQDKEKTLEGSNTTTLALLAECPDNAMKRFYEEHNCNSITNRPCTSTFEAAAFLNARGIQDGKKTLFAYRLNMADYRMTEITWDGKKVQVCQSKVYQVVFICIWDGKSKFWLPRQCEEKNQRCFSRFSPTDDSVGVAGHFMGMDC